jgi:hypothetical protein
MFKFKRPPDAVFQAILRESITHAIEVISDLLSYHNHDDALAEADFTGLFPEIARVYPPSLARSTLINLRRCLDRAEIYRLGEYHYLLLHDVLSFYADIHNSLVANSRSKEEKKKASFVDPFCIEKIKLDDLIRLFFFDVDFLYDAESLMNLPDKFKRSLRPEVFGLSMGLLPHPEELALIIDTDVDPQWYGISSSKFFIPNSKVYPYFHRKNRDVKGDSGVSPVIAWCRKESVLAP